jgi:hypothetical protein
MALAIVSFTMQSGALGKPGQIQTTPFQHSSKEKMHSMQISMQKRQRIECSGHTGIFHHPHYISLGPVKKLLYECGIFIQNYTLFSKYILLKIHIANPDSNLVVLNRAYEYWQPI